MRILVVEPEKQPYVKEISEGLEAMQTVVGGWIQATYPWCDNVALICNEEGKLIGLPLNRIIQDDEGRLVDIIAGTFFICYAPAYSENFQSLPENLIEKYLKKF